MMKNQNTFWKYNNLGEGKKVAALTVIKFSLHFSAIAGKGFFLSIGRKHTLCCQLQVYQAGGARVCYSILNHVVVRKWNVDSHNVISFTSSSFILVCNVLVSAMRRPDCRWRCRLRCGAAAQGCVGSSASTKCCLKTIKQPPSPPSKKKK